MKKQIFWCIYDEDGVIDIAQTRRVARVEAIDHYTVWGTKATVGKCEVKIIKEKK